MSHLLIRVLGMEKRKRGKPRLPEIPYVAPRHSDIDAGLTGTCYVCKREFLSSTFSKPTKNGYCQQCERERARKRSPEAIRTSHLKSKYGLSVEAFNSLLSAASHKCEICLCDLGTDTNFIAVDHCHDSGEVRGILCPRCNAGIGWFKDSPEALRSAARYLEKDR